MFTTDPQTMRLTYQEICQDLENTQPNEWIPLGNFMNSWYAYYKNKRRMLIKEPPELPENPTPEQRQWATFCAASVEYFCQKYDVTCPQWVLDPAYAGLDEPWYYSSHAHLEWIREQLREESPEPFKRRNIFVSRRIYANKWEIAEDLRERRSA
jgi:hypothetical protein